ncbi:MAG: hypothetical protein IJW31_07125 [Lentisphaeria bacterium]|nr:hypothetical protein [Lentisphaeria bacterium]MBR7126993.1 hypothetical protein [Lentisphaeria bacterium]
MKKITEDISKALEKCAKTISLAELSLRTGVKVDTLKRYLNRRAKQEKKEVFQKIYPEIRRYILLKDADEAEVQPVRIGDAPKMGHYLDDFVSDEKVLMDTFGALDIKRQEYYLKAMGACVTVDKLVNLEVKELSKNENLLVSIFRAMTAEEKEKYLYMLIDEATELMRERRVGI